jgi:hypothetical protein
MPRRGPQRIAQRLLGLASYPPPGSRRTAPAIPAESIRARVDLQASINRYIAEHNTKPKPFVWTADPDRVLAAIKRGHQALESVR